MSVGMIFLTLAVLDSLAVILTGALMLGLSWRMLWGSCRTCLRLILGFSLVLVRLLLLVSLRLETRSQTARPSFKRAVILMGQKC